MFPSFKFTLKLGSQITHFSLGQSIGFSHKNVCFLILLSSLNVGLNTTLNHLTNMSIANVSSTENISSSDVEFPLFKTFVAESFSRLRVTYKNDKSGSNHKFHLLFAKSCKKLQFYPDSDQDEMHIFDSS